ncbi:pr144 [rat cytomegalovirus strain Maastricht]|uniref:Pr144 n=1 Tax=Rat cytomegalovirus (strain Maastricht) TaxID=79700 RepID=Q9XR29_RCMVM|nr:pr144 [rat cytomegalovirus strain Maastricht]AAD31444.1 pr144 [rat cytomegalovirus strain Maastricht]WEG72058.1 membrane protein m144 [Murid betaherpesvirus 2]
METLWYAIAIIFPINLCHPMNSETGLRYTYTVTIDTDLVTCSGKGYLDGESFLAYSSENIHSQAKWLTNDNVESEKCHFKRRCTELEAELRKMTNVTATAGIRNLQVYTECTSQTDTTLAFNGHDVKSMSFNNTHAWGCSSRLLIYRNLMSKDVKFPHVNVERRLLHYSDSVKLRCSARDFYPAGLEIHWCLEKNNVSTRPVVERDPGPLPQGDGLYRKYVDIVVRVGEEHYYVCKIHGVATNNAMKILKWEGAISGFSDNTAFLLALFIPAFAAIVIIFFGFLWHRQGELGPIRVPGRPSSSNSAQHAGRRVTPLVDTAV